MIPLEKFKSKLDTEIATFLKSKGVELAKIDPSGEFLISVIEEFIKNGGKRIRPALFYYAALTYAKKQSEIVSFLNTSIVFELFQTFCLIHDDLIDNSSLRRNKPTVHVKYGQNVAILTGDLALMLADELFYRHGFSKSVNKIYNKFKQELVVGEFMDTKGSKNIEKVMELKTARYSFIRPVEIALSILATDQSKIDKWKKLLHKTGIVFQLKDDFMGLFSSQVQIGKSTSSDLREGKYTQVIKIFEEVATKPESEEFFSYFGNSQLSVEKCDRLRQILSNKGIPEIIKKNITTEITNIQEDLHNIDSGPLKDLLLKVILAIGDMPRLRL